MEAISCLENGACERHHGQREDRTQDKDTEEGRQMGYSRLFRPASCDLAGRLAKGALVFASMREELMDNCLPVMQGDVMNV